MKQAEQVLLQCWNGAGLGQYAKGGIHMTMTGCKGPAASSVPFCRSHAQVNCTQKTEQIFKQQDTKIIIDSDKRLTSS